MVYQHNDSMLSAGSSTEKLNAAAEGANTESGSKSRKFKPLCKNISISKLSLSII
jgi:hypothetical protein